MSFRDIGKIIRTIDGPTNDINNSNDIDLNKISRSTQVLYLFKNGKNTKIKFTFAIVIYHTNITFSNECIYTTR